jgi:hypothetical protein
MIQCFRLSGSNGNRRRLVPDRRHTSNSHSHLVYCISLKKSFDWLKRWRPTRRRLVHKYHYDTTIPQCPLSRDFSNANSKQLTSNSDPIPANPPRVRSGGWWAAVARDLWLSPSRKKIGSNNWRYDGGTDPQKSSTARFRRS